MKEKVVNKIMIKIRKKNTDLSETKLEEIQYGLYGLYSLFTKTFVVICISLNLNFFKGFIMFLIFYGILRSVGYGTHAKSNIICWIYSTILLIGIPYFFSRVLLSYFIKNIVWLVCFINFLIFCPADTEKRPMINKLRKMKFKTAILTVSFIYLILMNKFENISNIVIASMVMEAILTNPLGYILMGQKVRFKLNDTFIFKQVCIKKEV